MNQPTIPSVVLSGLQFSTVIAEASAQTRTGQELIDKYKVALMSQPESCTLANRFLREASQCLYDNGLYESMSRLTDYIQANKTSWALASACESILANQSSYNLLNRNAAHQVEKLLEQEEEKVVQYIRSGALKNVMYCESIRNIVKSVFQDQPIVEYQAGYTVTTPVSMVESTGDGYAFVVSGRLYKINKDENQVCEADWNEVSHTFRTIARMLNNPQMTEVDESKIVIQVDDASQYVCEEAGQIRKGEETFTVSEFREHARLKVMATNPRFQNQVAGVLEAVALIAEHYDHIVTMDPVKIYTTSHDQFVVIESGDGKLYASLLKSDHQGTPWTIQENAMDALSFIRSKTNVELGGEYKEALDEALAKEDSAHHQKIQEQMMEDQNKSIKERIEALTEKFKDDPTKLAILAKLASEMQAL